MVCHSSGQSRSSLTLLRSHVARVKQWVLRAAPGCKRRESTLEEGSCLRVRGASYRVQWHPEASLLRLLCAPFASMSRVHAPLRPRPQSTGLERVYDLLCEGFAAVPCALDARVNEPITHEPEALFRFVVSRPSRLWNRERIAPTVHLNLSRLRSAERSKGLNQRLHDRLGGVFKVFMAPRG
mgnify:CR=1 FL=1